MSETSFMHQIMVPSPGTILDAEHRAMVDNAVEFARDLMPILTDADALDARGLLEEVHSFRKLVEDRRVELKDPINRAAKQVDSAFKPVLERLDAALGQIKVRLTAWAQVTEAKRKAAEDEAERLAAANPHRDHEVAPITREVIQAQTSAKTVKTREFKTLVIDDPRAIPRDFLIPDERKILAALLADLAVPGCSLKIERKAVA